MPHFPASLVEFQRQFPDDGACAAWLVAARWPSGFRCPACAGANGWPHCGKPFTFEYAACGKQTSVTAGTILHGSKLPLLVWFWAVYLMATHSNAKPTCPDAFAGRDQRLLRRLAAWLPSPPTSHRARRSKPTAGLPTPAPPTSGTSPMSPASWPLMSFCPGSTRFLQRQDLGARRLSRTA